MSCNFWEYGFCYLVQYTSVLLICKKLCSTSQSDLRSPAKRMMHAAKPAKSATTSTAKAIRGLRHQPGLCFAVDGTSCTVGCGAVLTGAGPVPGGPCQKY